MLTLDHTAVRGLPLPSSPSVPHFVQEEHRTDHGSGASTSRGRSVGLVPPSEEAGEAEQPAEVQVEAEIQEGLQFLAAKGYPLDDTALAMLRGGVAAGYATYLQSFSSHDLVITPRTWAQTPDSKVRATFCNVAFWTDCKDTQHNMNAY